MSIKVSVIMPSLNMAGYIDECISSVLEQTIDQMEVICIDAESTDGTVEILQDYMRIANAKGIRMTVVSCPVRSYGYQINMGIKMAQGEYVGIVETDDYISRDMYLALYEMAKEADADIAKGDYNTFRELYDGYREYRTMSLWEHHSDRYRTVLDPSQTPYLYANDYNVWKGIYKRSFLIDNEIFFQETKGAAYQDIGFSELVLATARRAIYSEQPYYQYRIDRCESSIHSASGLKYAYQEFKRLLEEEPWNHKIVSREGLYSHLVQSFWGEYSKALRAVDYDASSEQIKPYIDWFIPHIKLALEEQLIKDCKFPNLIQDVKQIVENASLFSSERKKKDQIEQMETQRIVEAVAEKEVIVVGAGQYGKKVLEILLTHSVRVLAICDNDENKWGKDIFGISILPVHRAVSEWKDKCFVVAFQRDDTLLRQLVDAQIAPSQIIQL